MFTLNRRTKVFVSKHPTDMRSSYDSLFSRVKDVLLQDPFSGHLFVFVNLRRTSCKCLYYDGTGLVIISKRLESGLFSKVNPLYPKEVVLSPAEFSLFFEGAALSKRFVESPEKIMKNTLPNKSNMLDTDFHDQHKRHIETMFT